MRISVLQKLQNPAVVKMRSAGTPNFHCFYHDTCLMTRWAAEHSGSQPHPLKPKIQHLYQNRDRNTLWWRAISHTIPLKKVVRTTVAKRVRKIFCEVLFQQGYDPYGWPLPRETKPARIPVRYHPISGYMEIMISQGAVTQESADMRRELATLFQRTLRGMEMMRKGHGKKSEAAINDIAQLIRLA